ncbi:PREDICTED: neuroglian-like [Rhagoletis zephyria]|uniref:neuroglian-like n=1 Tax=Rhagoletis zephyria TaxID=28612 RepID=UPI000811358D|nr:PREDICTED: neuroglian-like [Rhagoletis zephyria]
MHQFAALQLLSLLLACGTIGALQSPPTMIKQPPHEQLFEVFQNSDTEQAERPFVLECEAKGNPEPTYTWKKNGMDFSYVAYDKRITQQPRRGSLVFTKPQAMDEGLYQCFAENKHGRSVSNAVFLKKAELNAFSNDEIDNVHAVEGEPLTIPCNPPTGYPKPQIFWIIQSNSGALINGINSSRLSVDPEGNLHFSNVTHKDMLTDALYACSATSTFKTTYRIGRRTHLLVEPSGTSGQTSFQPIKQYTSPPNVPAIKGNKLELFCIYGGTPLPEIRWEKRNGRIRDTVRRTNYGKTLTFDKVEFADEGTYECVASNGAGSIQTHAMEVVVKSVPYWIEAPNNTNAADSERVRFKCKADGIPKPKLQWFKNGEPFTPNDRVRVNDDELIIENVQEITDTAVYQCNASSVNGYAFRDFYLNVLKLPPEIIDPPEKETKAVVTSNVVLKCRVFGAPKPDVKWQKDDTPLNGANYEIINDGDLRIKNVLVTDQGNYKCIATNRFGTKFASGELKVKGKTKIIHAPENYEVAARKTAVFRCNAESDPSLDMKIQWAFNERLIDTAHDPRIVQATDHSLTITTTKELDSGIYTCIASTDLDSVNASATLTVQDVPNPPKIIDVDCNGLTAMVEWAPTGDNRAPILTYDIQYNTSFQSDNWQNSFVNVPAPDTKFKVAMSPWANFTFRVIAKNKIGMSEPSAPYGFCTTKEDVPYKNPDNVVGRGESPGNLVIRWTQMTPIDHNSEGFLYKVFWKRHDINNEPWSSRVINDWRQNFLVIENQPTFKPYRIRVEAHNRRGPAHITASEVVGWSSEAKPLRAPENFRLLEIRDHKSALVEWDPVPKDSVQGHFEGYKILTHAVGDDEKMVREVKIPPNISKSLVQIFKPNSRNIAKIVVYNTMYMSDPSNEIVIITPEGVPGPVASFEGIPMGSNAIYLFWSPPDEPNGKITGYRIFYETVEGTELGTKQERFPHIEDPKITGVKLGTLRSGTKYRVTVHAVTKVGMGEPFFIELETKGDDAAGIPDKPIFDVNHVRGNDGTDHVKITWYPNSSKVPGSNFYVQYRLKGTNTFFSTPRDENQESTIVYISGLDSEKTYEFRIVAVDGKYETPSELKEITPSGAFGLDPVGHLANFAPWFIGMMCAIALIIVVVVLVCIVKRNRGGKYSVHEKEVAHGKDDYEDAGFNEYNKPLSAPYRGSRQSLSSSLHHPESDEDSMADYEGDSSKFGEDGSFIGEYGKAFSL